MALKKLRWFRIMLYSTFLGGLWSLNEYYAWMSMRELSVNAANVALEERYWDILPSQCLRFWPLFIRKSQDMAAFLERTNPVMVETRMTGWGTFAADVKLLSPRVLIEWRGKVWCVSREGRMWNAAEGFGFKELKIPLKPLWHILEPPTASEDERPLPSGVFPSIFPLNAIDDFLDSLSDAPWFGGVEEVVLDHRAGSELFNLSCVMENQNFTILVQKDKYEWQELKSALDNILGSLRQKGGNYVIDATYEDKHIMVKNLSSGPGEGGSK